MHGCYWWLLINLALITLFCLLFNIWVQAWPPKIRACKVFILAMPGCARWSSSNSCCLPCGGITTRFPHMIQLSSILSSLLRLWNGLNSDGTWFGQPCNIKCSTLDMTGSCCVHNLTCLAETGCVSNALSLELFQLVLEYSEHLSAKVICYMHLHWPVVILVCIGFHNHNS